MQETTKSSVFFSNYVLKGLLLRQPFFVIHTVPSCGKNMTVDLYTPNLNTSVEPFFQQLAIATCFPHFQVYLVVAH